jgi:hypothetical protein
MSYKLIRGSHKDCHIIPLGKYNDPYCLTHHMYKLTCLHCGCEFHTRRPHTKYCSNAHRQAAYRLRKEQKAYA